MRVKDLTAGEKLFIERRRNGDSMSAAAKRRGVTLHKYRSWELDETKGPNAALGKLSPRDVFLLLRRRSGKTVKEIATELKCCPWWLRLMERGDAPNGRLLQYWGLSS